ncbi:MAG: hypothetical protein K6E34_02400 [Lachnospiraceae bacterium]|nr:hypothetical protein [Lachnospiraceae bacterium]
MRKIKVLYGFNNDKVMGNIEKALKALGRESLTSIRPNKPMIKEFIDTHPDLDVVVLKEFLDGGEQYGVEEFIELVQHTHVRFIILIGENYRGRKEIAELYAEGILDALFSDGKVGVDTAKIAELMVLGRTRDEAKRYYRIAKGIPERRKVTCEEYRVLYNYLKDKSKGANLMDRFVTVSRMITPMQMGHFITLLPDGMIRALKKYKEYYELNTYIYRLTSYQSCQKMKAPANARSGLTREIFEQKMKGDNLSKPEDYSEIVIEAAPRVTEEEIEKKKDYSASEPVESYDNEPEKAEQKKSHTGIQDFDMREYADMARRNMEARKEEDARILEEELNKAKQETAAEEEPGEMDEESLSSGEKEEMDFDNEEEEMNLMDMLGTGQSSTGTGRSRSVTGTVEEIDEDEEDEDEDEEESIGVSDLNLNELLNVYGSA